MTRMHIPSRRIRLLLAAAGGVTVALAAIGGVSAHEHRTIDNGAILMRVGWQHEPTYTEVPNAVQLFLSDAQGNPINDLGSTLQVQVSYAKEDEKSDELALTPASGNKGEYDAPLEPTVSGNYTFTFTGTIHGVPVNEAFTSSPSTFDTVTEDNKIEFPVEDPSKGQLSTGIERLIDRVDPLPASIASAKGDADRAGEAGIIAIVLGALSLMVSLFVAVVVLLRPWLAAKREVAARARSAGSGASGSAR